MGTRDIQSIRHINSDCRMGLSCNLALEGQDMALDKVPDKTQDMKKTWACSTVEHKQGCKQDWAGVQLA